MRISTVPTQLSKNDLLQGESLERPSRIQGLAGAGIGGQLRTRRTASHIDGL